MGAAVVCGSCVCKLGKTTFVPFYSFLFLGLDFDLTDHFAHVSIKVVKFSKIKLLTKKSQHKFKTHYFF